MLTLAFLCSCLLSPQQPLPAQSESAPSPPTAQQPEPAIEGLHEEIEGMRQELERMRLRFAREPVWRLFAQDTVGFTIKGWLAQGITWNPASPKDGFNGPVTPQDRSNEYQLNEAYAIFEDRNLFRGDHWSLGVRADLLYGTGYRFVTSAGLESNWNTGKDYGVAMPNAHLVLQTGDLETKLGHFTSPVGYFAVGTANNFFHVLPYTFQYGEPFTHTGLLSTLKIDDKLSLGAGVTNGWDSTANWNSTASGLVNNAWNRHVGAIATITKGDLLTGDDSLAGVFLWSLEPDSSGLTRTSRYLQTLVYNYPLAKDWRWVVQSDFGYQDAALQDSSGNERNAAWYGLNQYLLWHIDDQWQLGANVEWFRDDDGFRVVGATPSFGSPRARSFGRGPFQGDYFRGMVGAQWSPHANVIVRPAIVFDAFSGHRGGGALPFDDGGARTQWLGSIDLVLLF